MMLVYGSDASFVDEVVTHLGQYRHNARAVPADAHLFSEVVAHKADGVIGLAAHQHADEAERQQWFDALIAASNAPSAPRIVLVTPGPLDEPHVRALKRSGASYVVISSLGVRGLSEGGASARQTVWLSRRLLEREHAVVTKPALMCTILKAVASDTGTGIELAPDSASWLDALQAAGVRVVVVPNWLARLAYFCGARALYLATGQLRVRLNDREQTPAFAALPSMTTVP